MYKCFFFEVIYDKNIININNYVLEFTSQKSGWYRQNQNAILVFVFIILWSLSFHVS